MTALLILIGVGLVGVSAWLVVRAMSVPRLQFTAHLRQVESYGFAEAAPDIEIVSVQPRREQAVLRVAEALGRAITARFTWLAPIPRSELSGAGIYGVSPDAVHGYRMFAAAGMCLLSIAYVALLNGGFSLFGLIVIVAATAFGWQGPALAISRRATQRRDKIDRELPELIDLLVATVEAGLGLGASLRLVSGRFDGPLGDELRLTLHQQGLGISNEEALNELVERVGTPSVRSFTRTVVRAETLGTSIGPIMRNLATEMRRRRRQAANERVQKTPVKMLFPLVFLIFPSLFIVLLYPAVYTILHQLSG